MDERQLPKDDEPQQPRFEPFAAPQPRFDPLAAQAEEADPRDAVIAQLEAQLAALKAPPDEDVPPADPRDRAIWQLKRELAAATATPESEAEELRKAMKALQAEMKRMQEQQGLIPLPDPGGIEPMLYGMFLGCGCMATAQHPQATHTHCAQHDMTVKIREYFALSPEQREEADAAYREQLETASRPAR